MKVISFFNICLPKEISYNEYQFNGDSSSYFDRASALDTRRKYIQHQPTSSSH